MQSEYKKRDFRGKGPLASSSSYAGRADRTVSLDRVPPQALDVERTILGSMLIDRAAVDVALEFVTDTDFYSEAHSKIFFCMRELADANTPVDIITVSDKLRKKDWLEEIGSEAFLSGLAENVATAGNIQHYAAIVREKAVLRQLISVSAEISTDCFSDDREVKEILDSAEGKIFAISEARVKSAVKPIGQILPRVFEEIDGYSKGGLNGVPTGFTELDRMTTGLQKGELVIVGGRPSMGKTAFCLSIAQHAAVKAKFPTLFFSLEMSESQIVHRMLCSEARVDMHALRLGMLPKRDYPRLSMAAGVLSEAPLYINDTPAITVLELKAMARRVKAQYGGLALIIVDYLQLMSPSVKTDSMQQDISQISRSLKAVAKEFDVPLIALSQLSRAVEQRSGNHRPQLSDLRESGAIEQDADLVMFVYRDEVYNKDSEDNKGKAEIIIGKQRNGPIGSVEVAFVKQFARFENLADNVGDGPAGPGYSEPVVDVGADDGDLPWSGA